MCKSNKIRYVAIADRRMVDLSNGSKFELRREKLKSSKLKDYLLAFHNIEFDFSRINGSLTANIELLFIKHNANFATVINEEPDPSDYAKDAGLMVKTNGQRLIVNYLRLGYYHLDEKTKFSDANAVQCIDSDKSIFAFVKPNRYRNKDNEREVEWNKNIYIARFSKEKSEVFRIQFPIPYFNKGYEKPTVFKLKQDFYILYNNKLVVISIPN